MSRVMELYDCHTESRRMSRSVSVVEYVYGPLGADPFNIKCYCSDLGINLRPPPSRLGHSRNPNSKILYATSTVFAALSFIIYLPNTTSQYNNCTYITTAPLGIAYLKCTARDIFYSHERVLPTRVAQSSK